MLLRSLGKLVLVVSIISACSSGSFFSGKSWKKSRSSSSTASSGETVQSVPKDTGKPTDTAEGVPGYLVDPASLRISYSKDSKILKVTGAADSVRADQGNLEKVIVAIWEVSKDDYAKAQSGALSAAKATLLGHVFVSADGSFEIKISGLDEDSFVIVTTADSLDETELSADVLKDTTKSKSVKVDEAPAPASDESTYTFSAERFYGQDIALTSGSGTMTKLDQDPQNTWGMRCPEMYEIANCLGVPSPTSIDCDAEDGNDGRSCLSTVRESGCKMLLMCMRTD